MIHGQRVGSLFPLLLVWERELVFVSFTFSLGNSVFASGGNCNKKKDSFHQ